MGKFQTLLHMRFKQKDDQQENKMAMLAEKSQSGNLSSFAGIFRMAELNSKEKEMIRSILLQYQNETVQNKEKDEEDLLAITSEVKAITNQAVILHGERIKKAQEILRSYKEGAFSAWLMATYGNRQTPYNFLQYYEFYQTVPSSLHEKLDQMPRQAVYTLASRSGEMEEKEKIVKNYAGESKQQLLDLIRQSFPLEDGDRRLADLADQSLSSLARICRYMEHHHFFPTQKQKAAFLDIMEKMKKILTKK